MAYRFAIPRTLAREPLAIRAAQPFAPAREEERRKRAAALAGAPRPGPAPITTAPGAARDTTAPPRAGTRPSTEGGAVGSPLASLARPPGLALARVPVCRVRTREERERTEEQEHEENHDGFHADNSAWTRPLAPVEVSFVTIMELDQWLGVELRHFAALQAIAEEGTFGRAAQRLGYTQSAISQQIATLEKIVGEQLLERPGGPRP